jgi:hypothetical protein
LATQQPSNVHSQSRFIIRLSTSLARFSRFLRSLLHLALARVRLLYDTSKVSSVLPGATVQTIFVTAPTASPQSLLTITSLSLNPSPLSAMNASAPSTFCFLDLPKELRLMVYELLPVARIHRKVNEEIRLVVIWSPTSVLRVSRLVWQEASAIVKNAVAVYKHARRTCVAFGSMDRWDSMPRIIVANSTFEDARDNFEKLPGLINAALWWEAYLAGRDPPKDRRTTSGSRHSAEQSTAWRFVSEWAQHAAALLNSSSASDFDGQFDVAILTDDDSRYEELAWQTDIFDYGFLSDDCFCDDMSMQFDGELLDVNLIVVPPDLDGGREGMLSATKELGQGLILHACLLTTNEWEYMWAETEWL